MTTPKISAVLVILFALFSFTSPTKKDQTKSGTLKNIRFAGEIIDNYVYNIKGELLEIESIHGYNKYYYNKKGLLIREDYAMDPNSIRSSCSPTQKKVMMTAQNSTITSVRFFHYDAEQRLKRMKSYIKKNAGFELTDITEFLYKDDLIFRSNSIDTSGSIIYGFTLYTYDKRGNLINEKQYSNASPNYYIPLLMNETLNDFDDQINVNLKNKSTGIPGYETNVNNVIKREFIVYTGSTKLSTVTNYTNTLTFNENGLLIKEDTGHGIREYIYSE